MNGSKIMTHIFFEVERAVVEERFGHPHKIYEEGKISLHDVHSHPLSYEGAQTGHHLVEARVIGQRMEGFLFKTTGNYQWG